MNKISINTSNKIQDVRNTDKKELRNEEPKRADRTPQNAESASDRVKVSSRAAEVQQLTERVSKLPDVRSELVSRFQNAIAHNSYEPAASEIANALLMEEF